MCGIELATRYLRVRRSHTELYDTSPSSNLMLFIAAVIRILQNVKHKFLIVYKLNTKF